MKNTSKYQNYQLYGKSFDLFRNEFIRDLGICQDNGKRLLPYLADENSDIPFLLECHNTISNQWRDKIYTTSMKYIDDPSKWCIYYEGSLLHNAIINNEGIWLSNSKNFKIGNSKRHMHRIFDVDTDYFLFYKILGKYLFLEKQGLNNQIWTKDMKELIIELKLAKLENNYYKGLLDDKNN